MAKFFDSLTQAHRNFIADQHIYFCATAAATGRVNLSPKGMDSLRIMGPGRILWLNFTGSGNETAGHITQLPRMTLMWCSFTKRPQILRTYGTARAIHRRDPEWESLISTFGDQPGARQIFDLAIETVQTSCGYSIPFMEFTGERDTLARWADAKGDQGLRSHWDTRNRETIDGLPTGIEANLE